MKISSMSRLRSLTSNVTERIRQLPRTTRIFAVIFIVAMVTGIAYAVYCGIPDDNPNECVAKVDPKREDQLTIWCIDENPDGIAIALNDLRQAPCPFTVTRESDCKEIGLFMVIRDLLDKNRKTRMYSFNITRDIPYMNIRFQFATDDSLVAAWKQLFRSCVEKKTLDELSLELVAADLGPWNTFLLERLGPKFCLENPDLFMPKLVAADLASWNPFLLEWLGPEEYISDLDLFGPKWLSDLSWRKDLRHGSRTMSEGRK